MTECPAMAITQKNQVNSELLLYVQGKKNKLEFFHDTWNCLEVTILSFELSTFALYLKTITWNFTFTYETMLGMKIPSYHLLHCTENDNSDFFQANRSF